MQCQLLRNPTRPPAITEPVFATLGNLEGMHLGHQALCSSVVKARNAAGRGSTIAVTFYPHPESVLRAKPRDATLLTTLRQKLEVLGACGVEYLVLLHFTKTFAALSASDFVNRYLFELLRVRHLVVGPDAHVGHQREGSPEFLRNKFAESGRVAEILPFFEVDRARVSSGRVRAALASGEVIEARALLGRSYCLEGSVRSGAGRGKTIGIPTANIDTGDLALPLFGVYAGYLEVFSSSDRAPTSARYRAVANIGLRPTFGGTRPTVEVHALGYGGADFYGARARFHLEARVRGELKFAGPQELREQIRRDIEVAKQLLSASL